MNKIFLIIIGSLIGIFIGINYVYIYENDCIEINVNIENDGYLIGKFENDFHYAEYYIEKGKYYIFDEATMNTGKELDMYLKENNEMKIGKKYTLEYLYFIYTKTSLANFIKKGLT